MLPIRRSPNDRLRIIVLGYMVRCPLGGMAWCDLHYLMGLLDLGHDVVYIEDSDDFTSCYDPARNAMTDDPSAGLAFVRQTLDRIGMAERWTYYDAHTDGWMGPGASRVQEWIRTADVLVNLAGVNPVRPWFESIPVRVYIDKDPVFAQVRHLIDDYLRERAARHTAFFTFGENLFEPPSTMPADGFPWQPTRHPVFLDAWPARPGRPSGLYTTVMQWDSYRPVEFEGVVYGMKSQAFTPFLDLPARAGRVFELAVGSDSAPRDELARRGWSVRNPLEPTRDPWTYRRYIRESRGEFTVAKHGYVATRCGWFSERSAAYLATGRPVLTQETGFSDWLAHERTGLIPFETEEDVLAGLDAIASDYPRHCEAARAHAETYFDTRRILPDLLENALRGA